MQNNPRSANSIWITFFLAFTLPLFITTPARAEINIPSTLAALRSDDYATRQHATEALLADENLTPQDLKNLYTAATLPEQRQRLLDVARHHFVRRIQEQILRQGGPGSLGVGIASARGAEPPPDGSAAAARISLTYPGFPAYVYLRPGDLIVSVNNQPLPPSQDESVVRQKFIAMVQEHQAGSTIRLGVYRDGKTTTVALPLASFNALSSIYNRMAPLGDNASPRLQQTYDMQWMQYCHDLTDAGPPVEPMRINLNGTRAAPAGGEPSHLNQQATEEMQGEEED